MWVMPLPGLIQTTSHVSLWCALCCSRVLLQGGGQGPAGAGMGDQGAGGMQGAAGGMQGQEGAAGAGQGGMQGRPGWVKGFWGGGGCHCVGQDMGCLRPVPRLLFGS
jgi:hypothetical protein